MKRPCVQRYRQAISEPSIVTLGIKPDEPATGYGYIEQGAKQGDFNHLPVYRVTRFTEKPDKATAQSFIDTGKFSWNSGMFIFQAGVLLNEIRKICARSIALLECKRS